MRPPGTILECFGPSYAGIKWSRVPGGYSGATVWRGEREVPIIALKGWPASYSPDRLATVHEWMGRASHLPFIPTVFRTVDGGTFVNDGNRLWDATRWMRGSALEKPSAEEVEAACTVIAELHAAWRVDSVVKPAPGIGNRLRLIREWLSNASQAAQFPPLAIGASPVFDRVRRAISRTAPQALAVLEPWENAPLRCQPCIRDLRAEHVLFSDGHVTGIVDFGALAIDHPAFDLARLLGDFAEDDTRLFELGLSAYRRAGGEMELSNDSVIQLAWVGMMCSAMNWLRQLQSGNALPVGLSAVEARLALLLQRIQHFAPV